jgi:ribosomal protein S18 acetylase RimI-like enzyme
MIELVTHVDDALVAAFARLQPQLSKSPPPDRGALEAIVAQPGARLLVYRDGGEILGTLILTLYRIPTGQQARIDDVVVDDAARGKGVGEALSRRAIDIAREAGAKNVTLTSRPSREAANRLYQRLGFIPVETNVYRLPLCHD